MLKTDCDFNRGQGPNSIDSGLPKCRESLLSTSHWLTISSSFCKTVSMLDKHLSATKIAESSAYNNSLLQTASDISLTYIKNKRGPSIDPWRTPHELFACEERVPDTTYLIHIRSLLPCQWRSQNAENLRKSKEDYWNSSDSHQFRTFSNWMLLLKERICSQRCEFSRILWERILSFKSSSYWYGKSLLRH